MFTDKIPCYIFEEKRDKIDKNLMFNEYSGFYWLWKNYPLKDYIGMNHYSRYYACLDNLPDINEVFKKI